MKTLLGKIGVGIGGALAVFSPVGNCPVCLATATGIAGSMGLGLLASKSWFLPLLAAFLLFGLWGTIASARTHRRWHPVWATAIGGAFLIGGRVLTQTVLLWIGTLLLTIGLLLDLYWKRKLANAKLVRISGIE